MHGQNHIKQILCVYHIRNNDNAVQWSSTSAIYASRKPI